jgi:hypothetical protein
MPQINSSGSSLSAEQSQYFNTLSSQNSALQLQQQQQQQASVINAYQQQPVQYSSSAYTQQTANNTSSYGDQVMMSQPVVRRQKARVPPPSKIPSSAVEMPGDALNNMGYIDVQFGGVDYGVGVGTTTEDQQSVQFGVDNVTDKFSAASLVDSQQQSVTGVQQQQQQQSDLNDYQQVKSSVQKGSSLTSSQLVSSDLLFQMK